MKKYLFILFCGLICTATGVNAQTWQIGYPNAADITAVLSGTGTNRTLTISGNGAMQNFDLLATPWNSNRSNIRSLIFSGNITSIGNEAFVQFTEITSVNIPESVTIIGVGAFLQCTRLTHINIPESVTTIGQEAFASCVGLTSITIPQNVTTIGDGAFRGCTSLNTIYFNATNCTTMGSSFYSVFGTWGVINSFVSTIIIGNNVKLIPDNAFRDIGERLTSVTIGNEVTTIGANAFSSNSRLTSIVIPNNVETIGDNAFMSCSGLTSIVIPNSVTTIGRAAFFGCSGLTSVTISENVTAIEANTFQGCSGLTSVTIPENVTYIGNLAFSGCSGLTSVTVQWEEPLSISSYVFGNVPTNTVRLIVPQGTTTLYSTSEIWRDFLIDGIISITTQPVSTIDVMAGYVTGNLTVAASAITGATLRYQWYSNTSASNTDGEAISGETSANFTIPADLTVEGSPYYYFCEVSANGAFPVRSNVTAVTVEVAPIPVITINTQPMPSTNVTAGSITGNLSVTASVTPNVTLSYQWYSSATANNTSGNLISGATGNSFAIPATLAVGTYYYYCIVSGLNGATPVHSGVATVSVAAPIITITSQPPAITNVTAGSISGSLSVTANATPNRTLSYQWYSNTENINTGGTAIDDATSITFTIPANLTVETYYFYCVVSAPDGAIPVHSDVATVNVVGPIITITSHPEAIIDVTEGNISGSLSVTANATPDRTISYQWYSNSENSNNAGTTIEGATSDYFAIPEDLTVGTYYFYCVVSAPDGAIPVHSDVATVNVTGPIITITFQPQAITNVTEGSISNSLYVSASATPDRTIIYQWYSNNENNNTDGTAIEDATSYYYTIPANLTVGTYYYYCVVSAPNGAIPVHSDVATVNITAPVITITTQPQAITNLTAGSIDNYNGLSVSASVTPTRTLGYQWYSNSDNCNTDGTAIEGATSQYFTIPADLTVGTYYYYCVVSAPDGAIPVHSDVATINVAAPVITITSQPWAINVTSGNISSSLSVTANVTPTRTLSYQWYSNIENNNTGGTAIEGATYQYFTIPAYLTVGTYYYYCVVSAPDGAIPVHSDVAAVNVVVPVITITDQPTAIINFTVGNIYSSLSVTASVSPWISLSYQWYSNTIDSNTDGVLIEGATNYFINIPTDLTAGTYYYYCVVSAAGEAIPVHSDVATVNVAAPIITISQPQAITNVTAGSIDNGLYVSASVTPTRTLSFQWYSNNENNNTDGTAIEDATSYDYTIPANLTVGTYYYYCVVSAPDGAIPVHSDVATVNVAAPVITISAQPQAIGNITVGNISGNLSVTASVTPTRTLSYQWYSNNENNNTNGTAIEGATSRSFTIPNVLTVGTYYYYCVVSAPDGAIPVHSDVATVNVAAPVITISAQPQAIVNLTVGNISGNLSVTASVTPTRTLSYQWYSNNENNNTNGTAIEGATSSSFTIPNVLTVGTYYYYCVVSAPDGAIPVHSDVATVNVTAPVITIIVQPTAITNVTAGNISSGLSVWASVTPWISLSYQWYSNTTDSNTDGVAIEGATSYYYTIPANLTVGTYYYYCVVSAPDGAISVHSDVATVNVAAPVITISAQPQAITNVTVGNISSNLSVWASVTPNRTLSYQWYSNNENNNTNGTAIEGATSRSFTIPNVLTVGTYYYYCIVSAPDGPIPVHSDVATVNVTAPVIRIITQPNGIFYSTHGGFIPENLLYVWAIGMPTLIYQWYSNTTASNTGGTVIADATDSSFTIPTNLAEGTYYYYCVVSADGAISAYSNVATVIVSGFSVPVITITTQPAATTNVTAGNISGSLSVAASATQGATPAYQWFSNTTASNTGGAIIAGATGSSFTIPTNLTAGTYYYFCEVSAVGANSVRSDVATVTVTDDPIVPSVVSVVIVPNVVTVSKGATQPFTATVEVTGNAPQDVTWSVSGNALTATNINAVTCLLTVAGGETATTLTVRATSTFDNTKRGTATVTVQTVTSTEELLFSDLKIYPNPFTGEVRITGAVETRHATSVQIQMQIINAAGAIVYTQTLTSNDETVNLENLPSGVYMFRFEKDGDVRAVRVVKEN